MHPEDLESLNCMSLKNAARRYFQWGFSLVPLETNSKSAKVSPGWNLPDFVPSGGKNHWEYFETHNIGMHLGRSGLVTVDIDNVSCFKKCMNAIRDSLLQKSGVSHPFWNAETAEIISGRQNSGKMVFQTSLPLMPRKLAWYGEEVKCIFELRAGKCQDVLPPSIHPGTKKPYKWVEHKGILPVPADLQYLWENWYEFKAQMEQVNPAYRPPEITEKMRKSGISYTGTNYIEMWNESHPLSALLSENGYLQLGKERFLSPYSTTGSPGVVLYDGGRSFFSFGQSDIFADGHLHDAYDILVACSCHGDRKKAWSEVLNYFGVETPSARISKQLREKWRKIQHSRGNIGCFRN